MRLSRMNHSSTSIMVSMILLIGVANVMAQNNASNNIDDLIEHIAELENVRDPKCYATANRLEDFMYGTPLTDEARMIKFDIQKSIVRDIRLLASKLAADNGLDSISLKYLQNVTDKIGIMEEQADGDLLYRTAENEIRIKAVDYRQYASVAYIYRVLLSVEQDLLFTGVKSMPLPMKMDAIEYLNQYMNVMTLCVLKITDQKARQKHKQEVEIDDLVQSWLSLLRGQFEFQVEDIFYEEPEVIVENHNSLVYSIIDQKMKSYEEYNELNSKIFLRNIQVYFARQKWPSSADDSDALKNLFLEGMISFTTEFLKLSQSNAAESKKQVIRQIDVNAALQRIMPYEVNQFEDVLYYPNDEINRIRIESYDLDAFRDSGIHWKILEFALDDMEQDLTLSIDPQAAELVVEGIAQMGVLILRMAGSISHDENHPKLQKSDLEQAWSNLQNVINQYDQWQDSKPKQRNPPTPEVKQSEALFSDVTNESGIAFAHRSADWLSRLIRSFVFKKDENLARLSIPPAFGGSGVAAEDVDNDGDMDILLLSGSGNQLLLNRSDGTFDKSEASSHLSVWIDSLQSFAEPRQPIIADLDNDGWQDIVITYVNHIHKVYRNTENGNFEDVTEMASLGGDGMVAGPATAIDYDNDGLLDLYIGYFGNYVKGELPTLSRYNQNGQRNRMFRNMGGFRFEEVVYLEEDDDTDNGWTQAIGHSDINRDGHQDLIVGNDFGVNRYYLSNGDGTFRDESSVLGTDKPSYTMNVGIADLNQDLYPDFYISNIVVMQKDEKYVNPNENTIMKFDPDKMTTIRTIEANDLFISSFVEKGSVIYKQSSQIGRGYNSTGWSWDADFFDFDLDGDDDLYCLNGMNDFRVYSSENPFYYNDEDSSRHVQYAESTRERNVFFQNENGQLINRAEELGLDLYSNARSAAYLDIDDDGDLDIIVNNYHDRATLMKNNHTGEGSWLKVRLIGDPESGINLDAIGTIILVKNQEGAMIWREVHSTTGYLSVHPKEQHFGLQDDSEITLEVYWPNGRTTTIERVQVNRRYTIEFPDLIYLNE